MKTKHTAEPWEARDDDGTGTLPCVLAQQITKKGNFYVAQCNDFTDAQRIVACVNALAGIDDPEKTVAGLRFALRSLLAQVTETCKKRGFSDGPLAFECDKAKIALADSEGRGGAA